MRSAQSAMSESRVSRNGKGCIKQGRPQHALGQSSMLSRTGATPSEGSTHGLIRCTSASPDSTLAHANFHRIETSDSPGISHFGLNALPRESESSNSSNARIGKRGRMSATGSHRCQHAARRVAGLNIAAVLNRVSPQASIRAVARSVLEFTFLEHNLDSPGKRIHRNRFVVTVS